MGARLLQVHALAGTIKRDLALPATAYRANSAVHRRAEALFFSGLADYTAHSGPSFFIMASAKSRVASCLRRQAMPQQAMAADLLALPVEKPA